MSEELTSHHLSAGDSIDLAQALMDLAPLVARVGLEPRPSGYEPAMRPSHRSRNRMRVFSTLGALSQLIIKPRQVGTGTLVFIIFLQGNGMARSDTT